MCFPTIFSLVLLEMFWKWFNMCFCVPESSKKEEDFVVQRGKSVPTLSSVATLKSQAQEVDDQPSEKLKKEQQNQDTKSEERGESDPDAASQDSNEAGPSLLERLRNIPVAGKPSDAPTRHSIYARPESSKSGRSRRNSVDENASQLSVENLGGSQDNLSLLGRNPDKEMRTHSGRKSTTSGAATADMNYIDNRELEEMENQNVAGKVSFADLRRQKARDQFHTSGININYMENEKEDVPKKPTFRRSSDINNQGATWGQPQTNQPQPIESPGNE